MGNIFGRMPTDMFKAANLNLTFNQKEVMAGDADSTGNFSGVYGILQRNESDFSAFTLPLEAMRGDFNPPVKVLALVGETQYHLMSHPVYNRSIVRSDIEDSFKSIGCDVYLFYLILFFAVSFSISQVTNIFWRKKGKRNRRARRRDNKYHFWNLFRLVLKQGLRIRFLLQTQSQLFVTFEIPMAILIVLFCNHMSADLISYTNPELIDTLQDVWDAGDLVKISFTEATNVQTIFKTSPRDSLQYQIFKRSERQWNSSEEKYHLMPSSAMLQTANLIKKFNIVQFISLVPVALVLGLECLKSTYSTLYVSKDKYASESAIIAASLSIEPELEARIRKYHQRLLESGFHERDTRIGGELSVENFGTPSSSCLNTKEWEVSLTLLLGIFEETCSFSAGRRRGW